MLSISHFIYPEAPRGSEQGVCAVCGFDGAGQYLRDRVLDITTSNVTALFELRHDCICAPCYGMWSKPKHWHRGILATPGRALFPVISRESATPERPTWSSALRELRAGEPRAVVITTDPKKRVWPFARVSSGPLCSLYLHDPSRGVSGNRSLHLPTLISALDLIEQVYGLGFNKAQIANSLLTFQQLAAEVGLAESLRLESRLAEIRKLPEFMPALIVSQKEKETDEPECSPTVSIRDDGEHSARPRRGRRK